jgi:transcriptional regulator with XRE-family HTH domain
MSTTRPIRNSDAQPEWRSWMQHLGRQLRHMREVAGISQGQLARLAGVSQPAVSRLEAARGLATPLLVVVKIALALADELRKLDPAILDPDLRRALESPQPFGPFFDALRPEAVQVSSDPRLDALIRLYHETPERQRQGILAIMAAAVAGL